MPKAGSKNPRLPLSREEHALWKAYQAQELRNGRVAMMKDFIRGHRLGVSHLGKEGSVRRVTVELRAQLLASENRVRELEGHVRRLLEMM